ncbi:MAG: adaptor protein MecA [Clostridia bacterium]|nr:adaptor protein MecA [Clostridia bacterium]
MDFIVIRDKKLKIALQKEELAVYGLTVEGFDYSNVETKKALWQILAKAKSEVGFDAADQALYVEVYPSRRGGCEIFVTKLSDKRQSESVGMRQRVIGFRDMEALLAASEALLRAGYDASASVFHFRGRYALVLSYPSGEGRLSYADLALEFGECEPEETKAQLAAEGRLLCSERAVRLYGMLGNNSRT